MKNRLQNTFQGLSQEKSLGIMTHVVVGYPSLQETESLIMEMIDTGVSLIELQIPFSDPIADGATILKASDMSLKNGITIQDAFALVQNIRKKNSTIPLLFMGYSNSLINYGIRNFVYDSSEAGIDGFIIPDLPPDEPDGEAFLQHCADVNLAPILILSPTSSEERLLYLSSKGSGFFYCVARTGVTGAKTDFSENLNNFLKRCRNITGLPLAVGFGISTPDHVQFLKGKADIAVVGSETLRILERDGIDAASSYVQSLVHAGQ